MNSNILAISLSIVLVTIVPGDKPFCNGLNEITYSYRYSVENPGSGVVMQHWEERLSDLVHGSYSFLEPTGKVRVVHYKVTGKQGFQAVVSFRNPPTFHALVGHLHYPDYYRNPIILAQPVSLITSDLFKGDVTYPNFPP